MLKTTELHTQQRTKGVCYNHQKPKKGTKKQILTTHIVNCKSRKTAFHKLGTNGGQGHTNVLQMAELWSFTMLLFAESSKRETA